MKRPINADTLSPEQLADALAQLGWKQADFAHRTGVTAATVSAWATGKAPAPLWASAYLGAMLDLAALHRKYLAPERRPPGRLAHHLENPASPAPE